MSTRYGDRGFRPYGDSDEDRTEDFEREGGRGYDEYGGRADYGTQPRGYARGRGEPDRGGEGGRDYGPREYNQREYDSRESSRDYSPRDYSPPYGGSRYGREGGGGYSPRRRAGEDYGRGYPARDYDSREYGGRDYARAYGRDEGRGYRRDAGDERDEVRSFDTDYGRTTSRFYGRSGYEYGRDDYDPRDLREDYRGREYGRRDERREEGGGWWDRAAEELRSWFGGDSGGRRRHEDDRREGRGEGGYRGRGPRNYQRSDERIREDISERLADNDWLDASDIGVTVVAREVILDGTVDSRYAKRLAEEICESCSGVSHVQNNLRVRARQADFDTAAVAGANASLGGTTGSLGDVPLPTPAPIVTSASDPAASPQPDSPDAPTPARSSRAAGRS